MFVFTATFSVSTSYLNKGPDILARPWSIASSDTILSEQDRLEQELPAFCEEDNVLDLTDEETLERESIRYMTSPFGEEIVNQEKTSKRGKRFLFTPDGLVTSDDVKDTIYRNGHSMTDQLDYHEEVPSPTSPVECIVAETRKVQTNSPKSFIETGQICYDNMNEIENHDIAEDKDGVVKEEMKQKFVCKDTAEVLDHLRLQGILLIPVEQETLSMGSGSSLNQLYDEEATLVLNKSAKPTSHLAPTEYGTVQGFSYDEVHEMIQPESKPSCNERKFADKLQALLQDDTCQTPISECYEQTTEVVTHTQNNEQIVHQQPDLLHWDENQEVTMVHEEAEIHAIEDFHSFNEKQFQGDTADLLEAPVEFEDEPVDYEDDSQVMSGYSTLLPELVTDCSVADRMAACSSDVSTP